ncbi:MAG: ArgE/DapE family deacylase [Armatimonadetes bacterium]|nr:ArgE/DapE family deacylase [Armatimonadota bacterium]
MRKEAVRLVEDLLAIPTPNPPGANYAAMVDALERVLRDWDVPVRRFDPPGVPPSSRTNLIATWGSGRRTLHFHGHYDVVPVFREEQFVPRRQEGRLYGRGSADMKGGLVAMLLALRVLQGTGLPDGGRLILTLVPDEETGGTYGTAALLTAGLEVQGGAGMLMPEPTGGVIWHACRGALTVEITVRGRPAHVGMAAEGVNAFEGMVRAAGAVLALKGRVAARHGTMLVGGRTGGGASFNVVPDRCWFTVDRRFEPSEGLNLARQEIMDALDGVRREGVDIEVTVLQEAPAAAVPLESPLIRTLAGVIAEVTGRPPRVEPCPGVLEIRFFAQRGVPAVCYGPGDLEVSHGPEEYVEMERILQTAAIYAETTLRMLAPR